MGCEEEDRALRTYNDCFTFNTKFFTTVETFLHETVWRWESKDCWRESERGRKTLREKYGFWNVYFFHTTASDSFSCLILRMVRIKFTVKFIEHNNNLLTTWIEGKKKTMQMIRVFSIGVSYSHQLFPALFLFIPSVFILYDQEYHLFATSFLLFN